MATDTNAAALDVRLLVMLAQPRARGCWRSYVRSGPGETHRPRGARSIALGPFLASGADEHHQVEELHQRVVVRGADDPLDHDESPIVRDDLADLVEDLHTFRILPVVHDAPQHVCIRCWYRLEEAAADDLNTVEDPGTGQDRGGARHDLGLIEQDPAWPGVRSQDLGEHRAGAAADVGDDVMTAEVVGRDLPGCVRAAERAHRGVEDLARCSVATSVLPHVHPSTWTAAFSPVRTLCDSSPHASHS